MRSRDQSGGCFCSMSPDHEDHEGHEDHKDREGREGHEDLSSGRFPSLGGVLSRVGVAPGETLPISSSWT